MSHGGVSLSIFTDSRQELNYYTCTAIVEVLKQTEADSKNIFGYYSSQRMKDWQEVLRLYEKDSVYLGISWGYWMQACADGLCS